VIRARMIISISEGRTDDIEIGVLDSLNKLGDVFGRNEVKSIRWVLPRTRGHKRCEVIFDQKVRRRLAERLKPPNTSDIEIQGIIEMADCDVDRQRCSTVNRELNIVRGCFTKAVEWKLLAESPIRSIDAPFVVLVCRATLESLARISELLTLRREHVGPSWVEMRKKGGKVSRVAVTDSLRTALLARCHEKGFIFGEGCLGAPADAADGDQSGNSGARESGGIGREPSHHAAHRGNADARSGCQPEDDSNTRRLVLAPDARTLRTCPRRRGSAGSGRGFRVPSWTVGNPPRRCRYKIGYRRENCDPLCRKSGGCKSYQSNRLVGSSPTGFEPVFWP
jgi:hypothetical protein